jgi:hypothetical protein
MKGSFGSTMALCVGLTVLLGGCSALCEKRAGGVGPANRLDARLARCQRWVPIVFPAEAEVLHYQESHFMDSMVSVVVRLPKVCLRRFLESSPLKSPELEAGSGTSPNLPPPDWWKNANWFKPEHSGRFRHASLQLPNREYLGMVIYEGESPFALVYVHWFNT